MAWNELRVQFWLFKKVMATRMLQPVRTNISKSNRGCWFWSSTVLVLLLPQDGMLDYYRLPSVFPDCLNSWSCTHRYSMQGWREAYCVLLRKVSWLRTNNKRTTISIRPELRLAHKPNCESRIRKLREKCPATLKPWVRTARERGSRARPSCWDYLQPRRTLRESSLSFINQ